VQYGPGTENAPQFWRESMDKELEYRLAPRALDVKQAAKYLGVTVWLIRNLIWRGELPAILAGKKFIVDRHDLDLWLERQKGAAA
jgi:excisionase family DNA binding protein